MKITKRFFCLMLSLALCIGMLIPAGAMSVFAAETGDLSQSDVQTLVYNDGDVIDSVVAITKDTHIVVHGTVTMKNQFTINGGTITVSGGGRLVRDSSFINKPMFYISTATVTFSDITLDGNFISHSLETAVAIFVRNYSKVVINEGTIIENHCKDDVTGDGSAIYVDSSGKVTMNGGIIRNNMSRNYGGAVYVTANGTFNLAGGEISSNKINLVEASYGGGAIYIRNGSFNMTGGCIKNNKATDSYGGGIYSSSYAKTTISGGTITGNSVGDNGKGAGIYHSSREESGSILRIGGAAEITDEIHLTDGVAEKYVTILSKLDNTLTLSLQKESVGRVIAVGDGYTLTNTDISKMHLTNTDLALKLENNQIILTDATINTYDVYLGYDANKGDGAPNGIVLTAEHGAPVPTAEVDFTAIPVREGFTFLGWDTDPAAKSPAYPLGGENRTITVESNTTLYAVWMETVNPTPSISKLFSTSITNSFSFHAAKNGFVQNSGQIKAVALVDMTNLDLTGITTVDCSADKDGSVLEWFDSDTATLYVGGYGKIIASESLDYAFFGCEAVNSISGLSMLNTSNATSMKYMFSVCGRDSKSFTLDLGENFDTSRVTNMDHMFKDCGRDSKSFTLTLGDKFDTSNVMSMQAMFEGCGAASNSFTLDLGDKFDTSNVKNMSYMFNYCGSDGNNFTLDLGDKFDTSKVTDMQSMFKQCGRNSLIFTLDLGQNFNTSKVRDMDYMFTHCGEQSKAFTTLDLSSFTVAASTYLTSFASYVPVTEFVFGEGWTNAVLPRAGTINSAFYTQSPTETTVTGATDNLLSYNWAADNRTLPVTTVTYRVTAEAGQGGTVSGGGEVLSGESVILTATANDSYNFDGWYDGEAKVCDTAEFTVANVTEDKTYTAKFVKQADPYNFTTLRTKNTKEIVVNHRDRVIDITVADGVDVITIFEHQLDAVPGGRFKMASYMGNKVVYNSAGSYNIYFISNPTVTVKANIIIGDRTEQYAVNVHFDLSKAEFNFTTLRGENIDSVVVDHAAKTIAIQAVTDAESIILYVSQHDAIFGGTLRMASYMGNKVNYASNGVYTVYSSGKKSLSVKVNITINGVSEQYTINIAYPVSAPKFDFVALTGTDMENINVDHAARTIEITSVAGAFSITLPMDQGNTIADGTLRMISYMGSKISLDLSTRVYTVSMRDVPEVSFKVGITISGETKEYLVTVKFPTVEWGFDSVKAENVTNVAIDHAQQTITMNVKDGSDSVLLYIDQTAAAGLPGQIWMKSYLGNDVTYNADDRIYTIKKGSKNSIAVEAKITVMGETRYYRININFVSTEEA